MVYIVKGITFGTTIRDKDMTTYIHSIVTIGNREVVANTDTLIVKCNKPRFSMKCLVQVLKNVQYEIYNTETKEIKIVTI